VGIASRGSGEVARAAWVILHPSGNHLETGHQRAWLLVVLVVVAVAHRRLGPSSSATTSTMDRALPSSAVQVRCWRRPTTTTRLPFDSDSAACWAWPHHTTTVKKDGSYSRRPDTATRNIALAMPLSV
jgi:hypothetical protein